MSQTKYKKSDTCVICGATVFNRKHDGNFLCYECEKNIEKEIFNLLKDKSQYKDKIKKVSLSSSSSWGSTNKNVIIKIEYEQYNNIYIILSTFKVLEIRDLKDIDLLFNYLEVEINVQYITQTNKFKEMANRIREYKNNICELIVKTYNTNKETALAAINRSGLDRSLKINHEATWNIPDEELAEQIWEGCLKYKLKAYKNNTYLLIPEKYKNMSLEEIEKEKDRILKELKSKAIKSKKTK